MNGLPAADRPTPPATKVEWYVRPSVVLPLVLALIALTILFLPQPTVDSQSRLTTYSADPNGAQLIYDLSQRHGWKAERSLESRYAADPDVIHAVLAPRVTLRESEVHALLDHVRAGGGLLLVLSQGADAFADSLHLEQNPGGVLDTSFTKAFGCHSDATPIFDLTRMPVLSGGFRLTNHAGGGVDTLLRVINSARAEARRRDPAMIAMTVGKGRLVIAADANLLRNDAIRRCGNGLDVAAVRALEFLSGDDPSRRARIIFDEYRQGYGAHPGSLLAILSAFRQTSSGRTFYQLAAAGFILLLSVAPRAVPPRDMERVERRSPLEHVDALARAYAQVGATRTAAVRMLRGLRRRSERGVIGRRTRDADEQFLARLSERYPGHMSDVALIRRTLEEKVDRAQLVEYAAAISRIEHTLSGF